MMSRKLWDISQPLRPGLPVWPGDAPFESRPRWSHGGASPVNVATIALSTHSGAHADAPLHYDPAGLAIDAVALEPYLGPCRVVDARGQGNAITEKLVEARWAPGVTRMLFRTFDQFPHAAWPSHFTVLSQAAIRSMGARGVTLVGIDSPSLDPETSKTIALPLPLAGLDASPVRAVLREL